MKHNSVVHGDVAVPVTVFDPPGSPRGAVIILHEIFGANVAMQAEAARWAEKGYLTVLPDLYFRQQPGVALGYEETDRPAAFALWDALDVQNAVHDIRAVADWTRGKIGQASSVGVIGFCLGGQLAILSADKFDAAAAFYPVKMADHESDLRAVEIPLQVHCGTADPHIPSAVLNLIEEALEDNAAGELLLYADAGHAFYNQHRTQGYLPAAAEQARRAVQTLLAEMAE